MYQVFLVGLGGFIGSSMRYIITQITSKFISNNFPYGTLIVNVVGAIIIGFITELSLTTSYISPNTKLFLTTGIMGGLTTFSTFSNETVTMFSNGTICIGIFNIFLNVSLSLLGVVIGKNFIKII